MVGYLRVSRGAGYHTLQEHQRNQTNATVSRDSDIVKYENSIVVNGSIHMFNHAVYLSQD